MESDSTPDERRARGGPDPLGRETIRPHTRDDDELATREPALRPNTQLGRYTIGERIGSGGMGDIYRAHDPSLDRTVALKVLRPRRQAREGSDGRARMIREAQAIARLSHPNVISVYDVGIVDDRMFIAMELVEGSDLRTWLASETPRPWREIVSMFEAAGAGLEAAHEAGLVHRDFKPDNVLIGDDGRVRVTDFGLARPTEGMTTSEIRQYVGDELTDSDTSLSGSFGHRLTITGAVMGTPAYMAPEQHGGQPADARSDQYAFCVALYEALYGIRPFRAKSLRGLAAVKRRGRVPSPPAGVRVPRWLRRIVLRGLQPAPISRWGSMPVVLRQLRSGRSRARRQLWVAAAVAATAASAGVFTVTPNPTEGCERAGDRLAEAWTQTRRDTLRQRFAATGVPYADETWSRIEALVDDYTVRWSEVHDRACEQTRAAGDLTDRQMACLQERAEDVEALLAVYDDADAEVVAHAVDAVVRLAPLEHCEDEGALRSAVAPPKGPVVAAAVAEIRRELARARALEQNAKYPLALEALTELGKTSSKIGYPPVEAERLYQLGRAQEHVGDYPGAEKSLSEAKWLAASVRHDEIEALASAWLVYVVGHQMARYEDSEFWARHAKAAAERLRDDGLGRAVARDMLAIVQFRHGDFAEAREGFEVALATYRRLYGEEDPRVAAPLNNLGYLLVTQGKYDDARAAFDRAIEIRRHALGPRHPDLAASLNNLGMVAYERGNYDEAAQRYEEALSINRESFGEDHPEVAGCLNNLANVAYARGEYETARAQHERALAIRRRSFGKDHPHVALSLNNIGNVLFRQGQHTEAGEFYRRAVETYQRALGPEHPDVAMALSNLAMVLDQQGQHESALDHYQRALTIRRKSLGVDHPGVANILYNLGELYLGTKRYDEARQHFQQSLAILERAHGADHVGLSLALAGIGRVELAQSNPGEAVPVLERALALRESAAGDPRLLAATRFELAKALYASGKDRKRARSLARAARSGFDKVGAGDAEEADKVSRWLSAHGG